MPYYGVYRAVVADSSDPEVRGRLRLQIPQLTGEAITGWAWSVSGNLLPADLPPVGAGVFAMFEGGDLSYPLWFGSFANRDEPITATIRYADEALDLKANLASPTFTGTVTVPAGAVAGAAVNKGQLDLKAPLAGPTFTGTVTVPNASVAGAAVNKSQLDLKANLASPTFTGTVTVPDGTVSGAAVNKGQLDLKADTHTHPYVSTSGGTMTGNLLLSVSGGESAVSVGGDAGQTRVVRFRTGAESRWALATNNSAESGSNAGSNFSINRYDDAGTFLDSPISISRSSGDITTAGSIVVNETTAEPQIQFRANAGVQKSVRFMTGGLSRWALATNNSAESGSNAGSNFSLTRYDDAGSSLGVALAVSRSTGEVTVAADPSSALGVSTKQYVDNKMTVSTSPASGVKPAGHVWIQY